MKTILIYFDSLQNSGVFGTLRGLCAFLVIMILLIPIVGSVSTLWSLALFALAVCSAIGVQLPSSYLDSVVYSALVSLVICVTYCCLCNLLQVNYIDIYQTLVFLTYIVLVIIVAAVVTRFVASKLFWYGR